MYFCERIVFPNPSTFRDHPVFAGGSSKGPEGGEDSFGETSRGDGQEQGRRVKWRMASSVPDKPPFTYRLQDWHSTWLSSRVINSRCRDEGREIYLGAVRR